MSICDLIVNNGHIVHKFCRAAMWAGRRLCAAHLSSDTLQHDRDTLTDADAHGGQRFLAGL
ncbi:MAG: hypothetical protein ABGW90_04260, partial [Martelella sp.]